jgi:hypothetical protein
MRRNICFRAAIAVTAAAAGLLVGSIGTAQADTVVDHSDTTAAFYYTYGNIQAHIYKNTSTQAYAVITKSGSYGVSSRAQCERGNGGTQWYQSTIHATSLGSASHYDCNHNGTYNRAVTGLGGDFY